MKLADVKKVAIFGAGTMGPGLAQTFAVAGYQVSVYTRRQETLDKAKSVTMQNMKTFAENGLLRERDLQPAYDSIIWTLSAEECGTDADLVVETVAEKKEIKQELYETLDKICPERTVFTSNTSYLNIYEVMPEKRLSNTVIAHWFAPPHVIPLVEVVKGEKTSQETVDFVVELLTKVGKVPCVIEKFVPGFCINRFLRIIGRECFFLLDNGYMTAEQLDLAVKASIIPRAMVLGFVQRYDFTGIDLSYNNLQNPDYLEPPIDNQPKSLKELMDKGEVGVKAGKGFFDYSDRPLEQVLRERDAAMIKVFEDVKDLITKHI